MDVVLVDMQPYMDALIISCFCHIHLYLDTNTSTEDVLGLYTKTILCNASCH